MRYILLVAGVFVLLLLVYDIVPVFMLFVGAERAYKLWVGKHPRKLARADRRLADVLRWRLRKNQPYESAQPEEWEIEETGQALAAKLVVAIFSIFVESFVPKLLASGIAAEDVGFGILLEPALFAASYVFCRAQECYSESQLRTFMQAFNDCSVISLTATIEDNETYADFDGRRVRVKADYDALCSVRLEQYLRFRSSSVLNRFRILATLALAELLEGKIRWGTLLDANFLIMFLNERCNDDKIPVRPALLHDFAHEAVTEIYMTTLKLLCP